MAAVIIDKSDLAALDVTLNTLKNESPIAIVRATNDAMKGVNTESAKLIGAKVTLSAKTIKKHFKINFMKASDMTADITCTGDPVPLIEYSTRSTAKGVTVKVLKQSAGGRKLIKHAFPVQFKSGKKHIVWRKTRFAGSVWPVGKRRKLPSPTVGSKLRKIQLPLTIRYGPRVPDIFDDPDIMTPILANASTRFDDRLQHHTNQLIARAR